MKLSTGAMIDDLNRWHRAYNNEMEALMLSKNTIELYNRAITQYIEYMHEYQEDVSIDAIRKHHITGFLSWMEEAAKRSGKKAVRGRYLSKSTKQTYLKAVKGLFGFISDNNDELFTFDRIFKNIKIPSDAKAEEKVDYLTDHEVGLLLAAVERGKKGDGYNGYRDALLVKIMLFAGLRISEALGVRLCDFASSGEDTFAIQIYAKGGKEQTAYISSETITDELEYLRKATDLGEGDSIMRTRTGKTMTRQGAFLVVNNLYRRAGVNKAGLHLLRHTFAMRMTLRGVSPIDIKEAMRHSNINTTMIYAKATKQTVMNAVVGAARK